MPQLMHIGFVRRALLAPDRRTKVKTLLLPLSTFVPLEMSALLLCLCCPAMFLELQKRTTK
ncbi:MAG: hypothetical protein FWG02_01030 [Holophagaceae bacterium]|nr:hypothetical protein [Holophagaceae bacterium]